LKFAALPKTWKTQPWNMDMEQGMDMEICPLFSIPKTWTVHVFRKTWNLTKTWNKNMEIVHKINIMDQKIFFYGIFKNLEIKKWNFSKTWKKNFCKNLL
jgi:hypothetical protein